MDLPSVLGGAVQGFKDFGTGLVDFFGTGGASILDLIDTIQTGKATSQRQDDYRKWLYNTDDNKDAAAKGLGTILNGVQTVSDYIPGLNIVSQNPLFNAGQGAVGGIADELKTYGKDYDLGRAGQRALVSGGAALASGTLGDALGTSTSPIMRSNTVRGAAKGALGGAINQGGYTAIEGGNLSDILSSAGQGATMGGVIGGVTGMIQDFKPAKTYATGLTEDEKAARIANAKNMLANEQNPERIAELNAQIERLGGGVQDRRQAQFDLLQKTNPMTDEYHTGIRSPEEIYTLKSIVDSYNADNNFTYPDFTLQDAQKALANGELPVYSSKPIEPGAFISPSKMMATDYAGGGNIYTKNIPIDDFAFIESGDEGNYLPIRNNPQANDPQVMEAIDAILSPEQKEFFKDSVIRDENGSLKKLYHSTPNKFTAFDDGRLGENTAYDNTAFGHFVTSDDDFSRRFRNIDNINGKDGYTMELYANVKKPITHPYEAAYKYKGDQLDDIVENYFKETNNPEGLEAVKSWADDSGQTLYDAYMDMTVEENPFEMAAEDRKALQGKGYDAVEFVEGLKSGLVDGSTDDTPISSYAIFSGNQLKDINNLKPTSGADIMEELIPDTNNDPQAMQAIDNILAIDNELIQDIKPMDKTTRAQQIIDNNADIFNAPVKNALYDKIDPKTLPAGYEKLIDYLDTQNGPNSVMERKANEYFGTPYLDEVPTDKLLDYVWGNDNLEKKVYRKSLDEAIERNERTAKSLGLDPVKAVEDAIKSKEQDLRWRAVKKINQEIQDEIRQESGYSDDILYALLSPSNKGVRTGYAGALDTALSERLGIAPGNTIKNSAYYDIPENRTKSLGRYDRSSKDIAINEKGMPPKAKQTADGFIVANTQGDDGIEPRLSTMAHERLHSFQNEAMPENIGRYSKEVTDAYSELRKDLEPFLKSEKELAKRYKDNKAEYWARQGEQESRMLQNYLDNKGITKDGLYGSRKGEWGNEINPAFDKFFDKLRKLSKKGVALPAITALLGGGAYLTTTADDKDKEIK